MNYLYLLVFAKLIGLLKISLLLDLELSLNHPPLAPPIKGGENKHQERDLIMSPLPSWERDRVRGRIISFPARSLHAWAVLPRGTKRSQKYDR